MEVVDFAAVSACRHCQFYKPEGRRGGHCQQLDVPVQGQWQACSLSLPPFAQRSSSPKLTGSIPLPSIPLPSLPLVVPLQVSAKMHTPLAFPTPLTLPTPLALSELPRSDLSRSEPIAPSEWEALQEVLEIPDVLEFPVVNAEQVISA
jgi:hypothetical protein